MVISWANSTAATRPAPCSLPARLGVRSGWPRAHDGIAPLRLQQPRAGLPAALHELPRGRTCAAQPRPLPLRAGLPAALALRPRARSSFRPGSRDRSENVALDVFEDVENRADVATVAEVLDVIHARCDMLVCVRASVLPCLAHSSAPFAAWPAPSTKSATACQPARS